MVWQLDQRKTKVAEWANFKMTKESFYQAWQRVGFQQFTVDKNTQWVLDVIREDKQIPNG